MRRGKESILDGNVEKKQEADGIHGCVLHIVLDIDGCMHPGSKDRDPAEDENEVEEAGVEEERERKSEEEEIGVITRSEGVVGRLGNWRGGKEEVPSCTFPRS